MHPPTEPQGQRAVGSSFAGAEGALERSGTTQGRDGREGRPEATCRGTHRTLAAPLAPTTGEAQLVLWAACGMGI